ncbi:pimeloyl-ACP methyl ester esterase BioH [Marinobacterium arenosum]|uniref:pimeloyl-ACP methyl ester esterase BioH n=1 Tax=Marinobacterium arenosum TaxID=2862496 RepID=UPI001C97842C|nr:pimeloyl-ACP methyl ester esterase BioH [Marinobacterium arenosum]MBY4678530.1 pimeloyl-ACP methyl ester esterase BioH [Marinobacterium arenosum]
MSLYRQTFAEPGKPELVLLHGWGMHSDVWQPLIEPLRQHFSLTLFDLPGLGRSTTCPQPYTLEALADSLLAEAPAQAHWLGWSLGGSVATAVAAKAPQRVLSLTTLASNPCFVQRADWPWAMTREIFDGFQQSLADNPTKTLNRFVMLQTQGADAGREILRSLKGLLALYPEQPPVALADSLALLVDDRRALLSDVQCPMLALWGERDQLVPAEIAEAMAQLKPDLQQQVYDGAGHLPFLSHSAQFVDQLCRFTGVAE